MSAVKYKVGDKVVVKSLDWYNANKDAQGRVNVPCCFIREMSKYCGKVVTIRSTNMYSYCIEDCYGYSWSDEMFEDLGDASCICDLFAKTGDLTLLPSSVERCAAILGVKPEIRANDGYMGVVITTLQELYICRDAYWKMANNWEPDYTDIKTKKHCIVTRRGRLSVATTTEMNRAFAFPTPEMAGMFVKNFGSKLNLCREML
jgi:hypothetical protein